ncbi:hypothetical protein SAMN06265338_1267 [Rhodoblastus acidophilus]|uniref:Uncharacterized protein n=1 Tax=Rhodoblastus acidophilus TaxID=1074 RepID=A0A212SCZ3_RHOAC|nr:hypothetical protein SAMN06265338_1267 [Rhodoblastus acidophilus]
MAVSLLEILRSVPDHRRRESNEIPAAPELIAALRLK